MVTVRTPHTYDALRETHRKVEAERESAEADRAATARQEQVPAQQPAFLNEIERLEAYREALTKELRAQAEAGKIAPHDVVYQLQRFENGDEIALARGAAAYEQARGAGEVTSKRDISNEPDMRTGGPSRGAEHEATREPDGANQGNTTGGGTPRPRMITESEVTSDWIARRLDPHAPQAVRNRTGSQNPGQPAHEAAPQNEAADEEHKPGIAGAAPDAGPARPDRQNGIYREFNEAAHEVTDRKPPRPGAPARLEPEGPGGPPDTPKAARLAKPGTSAEKEAATREHDLTSGIEMTEAQRARFNRLMGAPPRGAEHESTRGPDRGGRDRGE